MATKKPTSSSEQAPAPKKRAPTTIPSLRQDPKVETATKRYRAFVRERQAKEE